MSIHPDRIRFACWWTLSSTPVDARTAKVLRTGFASIEMLAALHGVSRRSMTAMLRSTPKLSAQSFSQLIESRSLRCVQTQLVSCSH